MTQDYQSFCNSLLINDEVYYKKFNDQIELYSYGCPDSIWDLEVMASCFIEKDLKKPAVFIDTCCAIDLQENISKRIVDRLLKIYEDKSKLVIITGCGVSYEPDYYKDKGDASLSNNVKQGIYNSKDFITNVKHINGYIKISDGCYFNCAYCAIKNVRPKYMFTPEEIIKQVRESINNGIIDICLFGTEISLYDSRHRSIFDEHINLTELIKKILNEVPEITSIKLDSINPGFYDIDNLITLIKNEPKMQKELDLAVQSCSNTVLKKMRRPYTVEQIKHVCETAKGLDIQFQLITGFPGETDELFNESLAVIKNLAPNRITLCPFSARKNTEAYHMADQIPHEIAKQREKILIDTIKTDSNQKIEKINISKFNNYKPKLHGNCRILETDLYDTDEFAKIYKWLKNNKHNDNIVIYYNFDKNKDIEDLDINIKLLIVTFGVKVIGRIKIDDDTIKINYPKLLTNDLTTFVEFSFDKLEIADVEDVATFFKDLAECNLDNIERSLHEFIMAGNQKFLLPVIEYLNMDI